MRRPPLLDVARVTYLELLFSLRIPASVIFVFLMPALVMLALNSRHGDPAFLVPGLLALVTAFSTLQGVGQVATSMRRGIWSTFQVAIDPDWIYLAGVMASRVVRTLVVTTFLLLLARVALGFALQGSLWVHLGLVLLGSVSFAALGLLLAYLPRSPAASAQAVTAAVLLMTLVGGIFFVPQGAMRTVAELLPLTHLAELVRANASGAPLDGARTALSLVVLGGWGAASAVLAYALARRREED